MTYTLICFTFNEVPVLGTDGEKSKRLQLRNNWIEDVFGENQLFEGLKALGIEEPETYCIHNRVTKISSDFTVANTKIIIHVIKN